MKMSDLFGQTLRGSPSEAEVASHQLLIRAGYIRQLGAGIFSYLHLAKRSMGKIENILRDEMDAIGGQEIAMPVVNPADLWKETGRWYQIGPELGRFLDRNQHDMVLAMTHEEVISDLARKEIQSYKQLPRLVYHIQTKWRDEPRSKAGLIRVREFTMKDSYSLDADWEGLDKQYRAHYQAYFNIFHRCGLPVIAVKSDVGLMGGKLAHEFMFLSPIGEDTLIICDTCGYTANRQIARFKKPAAEKESLLPMQKVLTPGIKTIAGLATFLNVPEAKTAKAVFYIATLTDAEKERKVFVFAIVRGDMDVNETKLVNAIKAKELRPALEEEILQIGAVPGFASPIGVKDALVIVDDVIPASPNLVAGANLENYHFMNVNFGRDFEAGMVTDIAAAEEGCLCSDCGNTLHSSRGIEVGNIFKLGTRYSDSLKCTFLDKEGQTRPVVMGSYGIGVGRLLACIAEEYHDENGLIWPITVAPFQVHLVSLRGAEQVAGNIYALLRANGIEVLYDDRDESPGVKFNDADLMGMPIRITAGQRSLKNNNIELKFRRESQLSLVPLDDLIQQVKKSMDTLQKDISRQVVQMDFDG